MAKVSFSKLKCKMNEEIKTIDFANEKIEVKQYLPIQDKLRTISTIINESYEEDYNFFNPTKVHMLIRLQLVMTYTNLSFTEKQKEEITKTYDCLVSSGLEEIIINSIPTSEYNLIYNGVKETLESIYKYQNSAYGVIEGIKKLYKPEEVDMQKIFDFIKNFEDNSYLKELKPYLDLLG